MQKAPTMEDLYSLGDRIQGVVKKLYFNPGSMGLEFKSDSTPVTIADKTVHKIVGDWRDALFPDLSIVSEEGHKGKRTGDPEQHWVLVDEIDGTWGYMIGMPVFSSLVALMRGGQVVASVIVDPIGRRIYSAERGKGAYCNRKRTRVHESLPKTPAVAIVTWPKRNINDMLVANMQSGPGGGVAGALHDKGWAVINAPTIGYMDALVASGQIAGTIFPGPTLHDTAAGDLLVREAGGVTSDIFGSPLEYSGDGADGHVFACSEEMHQKLIGVINSARRAT